MGSTHLICGHRIEIGLEQRHRQVVPGCVDHQSTQGETGPVNHPLFPTDTCTDSNQVMLALRAGAGGPAASALKFCT